MKIFEVRVDLTRQFKQYESDKVGLSACLEDGDDVYNAIDTLKQVCLGNEVAGLKGGNTMEVELVTKKEEKAQLPLPIEEKPTTTKARAKAKPEQVRVEKPVEVVKEEPVKEEPVKEEPVKEAKVKTKLKSIEYDRSSDLHKKHVGKLLDSLYSDWRTNEAKLGAAKKVSITMEGRNFMDGSGEILDSFKKEFTSSMVNELSKT